MAKPKAQTLQQRFGFVDEDLKTATHDEIMIWLDQNAFEIIGKIVNWTQEWNMDFIKEKSDLAFCLVQKLIEHAGEYIATHQDKQYNEYTKDYQNTIEGYQSWFGLGDIPSKPSMLIGKKWEYVIQTQPANHYQSSYTIGFVDMRIKFFVYELFLDGVEYKNPRDGYQVKYPPKWGIRDGQEDAFYFEVKSAIPSVGELIRQINMYRQYVAPFYVVSPDDKFVSQLLSQNIGFVKYPTGEVFKPGK